MPSVKAWELSRDEMVAAIDAAPLALYWQTMATAQNAKTIREVVELLNKWGSEYSGSHQSLEARTLDHAAVLLEQAAIAAGYENPTVTLQTAELHTIECARCGQAIPKGGHCETCGLTGET